MSESSKSPRYGLVNAAGELLTAPRRIQRAGRVTKDPAHARVWKTSDGAYKFRKAHPELKDEGFVVRFIAA